MRPAIRDDLVPAMAIGQNRAGLSDFQKKKKKKKKKEMTWVSGSSPGDRSNFILKAHVNQKFPFLECMYSTAVSFIKYSYRIPRIPDILQNWEI